MGNWTIGLGVGGTWDYMGKQGGGFQAKGSVGAAGGVDGKEGGVGFDFSVGGKSGGSIDFGICTGGASKGDPSVITYGELLEKLGLGKTTAGAGTATGTVVTAEDDLGEDEDAIAEYEAKGGSTTGSSTTDETDDTDDADETDETDDTEVDDDRTGPGDGIDGPGGGGSGSGSSDDGEGDDGCGGGALSHLGSKHGSGSGGSGTSGAGSSGGAHGGVHGGGDGDGEDCGTGGRLDLRGLASSHGSSHGSGKSDGTGRPHLGPDDYFPSPDDDGGGNPVSRGADLARLAQGDLTQDHLAKGDLAALATGRLRTMRVG